jgi:hypothetical protein
VVIKLICLAIATEAIVELWKSAAPLRPFRESLIRRTPHLYDVESYTHLFACPYCCSVYVGAVLMALYVFWDNPALFWFTGALSLHRISNVLHLFVSLARDRQMDLRIARGKPNGKA